MKIEIKKIKRIKGMKMRETHLYMHFTSLTKFHTPNVQNI